MNAHVQRFALRAGLLAIGAGLVAIGDAIVRPHPLWAERVPKTIAGVEIRSSSTIPWADLPRSIGLEDAVARYNEGAFFVDARPLVNYLHVHIDGAYHLDVAKFRAGRTDFILSLPTDTHFVIYCEGMTCDASFRIYQLLANAGFNSLEVFGPGIYAWVEAGLPTGSGSDILEMFDE